MARPPRRVRGGCALGDLGSHIIDIAQYLCGTITGVYATTPNWSNGKATPGVDDLATLVVDFEGGAGGVVEASWALRGHKCDLGFDLVCERGAIRFAWERSNEVGVLTGDVTDPDNGYRTVLIGGGQPDVGKFVAVPAQGMGYRDAFTIGVAKVLTAIHRGDTNADPSFIDGFQARSPSTPRFSRPDPRPGSPSPSGHGSAAIMTVPACEEC